MAYQINNDEEFAMKGLPHVARLVYSYLRQHMDFETGITGIKRKVSLQGISEYLYVEPHQGIKEEKYTHKQVRSALNWLEKAGLIERDKTKNKSNRQSVFKLILATRDYSAQNKEGRGRADKEGRGRAEPEVPNYQHVRQNENLKVDNSKTQKVVMPPVSDINNNKTYSGLNREKYQMTLDWLPDDELIKNYLANYGLDKEQKVPIAVIRDFRAFWEPRTDLFNTSAQWCSALVRWYKNHLNRGEANANNQHSNINQPSRKSLVERVTDELQDWVENG